jgi:hypothetical protein
MSSRPVPVEVTWRDVGCPRCQAAPHASCPVGDRSGHPHVERLQLAGRLFYFRNAELLADLAQSARPPVVASSSAGIAELLEHVPPGALG